MEAVSEGKRAVVGTMTIKFAMGIIKLKPNRCIMVGGVASKMCAS